MIMCAVFFPTPLQPVWIRLTRAEEAGELNRPHLRPPSCLVCACAQACMCKEVCMHVHALVECVSMRVRACVHACVRACVRVCVHV